MGNDFLFISGAAAAKWTKEIRQNWRELRLIKRLYSAKQGLLLRLLLTEFTLVCDWLSANIVLKCLVRASRDSTAVFTKLSLS